MVLNERPQSWDHVQCKDRKVSLSPATTKGTGELWPSAPVANATKIRFIHGQISYRNRGTKSVSEMLGVRIVHFV